MGAVFAQPGNTDTKVAAQRRFKGYGPGRRQKEGKLIVEKDETIERLTEDFRRLRLPFVQNTWWGEHPLAGEQFLPDELTYYLQIVQYAENKEFSAEDIERFSLALSELQDEKHFEIRAGVFLSALINTGSEGDYTIHTDGLSKSLRFVGFFNRKNITVNGHLGDCAGYAMRGGRIVLEGDVFSRVGERMSGGEIWIEGDAENRLGAYMKGGKIHVNGNAFGSVGDLMKGGEIHIEGEIPDDDFKELGYGIGIQYGKVYHKGKLIVDR